MQIKKSKVLPDGRGEITIVLDKGEGVVSVRDGHYKLGYPHEDVVESDVIRGAKQVSWCSVSQAWVE